MKSYRLFLISVYFVAYALTAFAQHGIAVHGTVTDGEENKGVSGVLVRIQINGHLYSTLTDSAGVYSLSVPFETEHFILMFSHTAFLPMSVKIETSKRNSITHNARLKYKVHDIRQVNVNAVQARTTIHNDTIIYHADAYKMDKDASMYDLVSRKLPGVSLRDGKLEAHGQTVSEVLVDGKEMYKGDVSLALKNIPVSVIKDIEVFDQMSDYSRLTGFDDGSRRKVMNLRTEHKQHRSIFGKAYGGLGFDKYYQSYIAGNVFRPRYRLSLFAQDNNISEQNFSMVDLLSSTGTATGNSPNASPYSKGINDNTFHPATSGDVSDMMVGGFTSGETTTRAVGTNFSGNIGKSGQLELTGHYFFNRADNSTDYDIRDEYFNEGSNVNLQQQYVHTSNTNHRLNTKWDWNLGRNDHLMFRPSLLFQRRVENTDMDINEEDHVSGDTTELMNQTQATEQKAIRTDNELMYIHRLGESGHSLSTNVKFSLNDTEENINLDLINKQTETNVSQYTYSHNHHVNIAAVGSYIHRIDRNVRLRADLGWNVTYREIKRATKRGDEGQLDTDSVLSGRTNSDYGGLLAGASFLYDYHHTHLVGGAEWHRYDMYSKNDVIHTTYTSSTILPFLHFRHEFSGDGKQMHIQYRTEQTYPTTIQLQDAMNNTNPTQSIRGNINLLPSYSHNIAFRFLMPTGGGAGIFVLFANAELIRNYIANKRNISGGALGVAEERSQVLTFTNADGYVSGSSLIAYGFPVTAIHSNVNLSSLIRYSRVPGYWDSELSFNRIVNWSGSATIGSNISHEVDFVIDVNAQFLHDRNELHAAQEVRYWTFSYGGQLNWTFLPRWKWVVECGRTSYHGLGTSEMNAVIGNVALTYKILRGRQGELKLSCSDVFNQNNDFTRLTNELFLRKQTASALGRFCLLTFTYTLNSSTRVPN